MIILKLIKISNIDFRDEDFLIFSNEITKIILTLEELCLNFDE